MTLNFIEVFVFDNFYYLIQKFQNDLFTPIHYKNMLPLKQQWVKGMEKYRRILILVKNDRTFVIFWMRNSLILQALHNVDHHVCVIWYLSLKFIHKPILIIWWHSINIYRRYIITANVQINYIYMYIMYTKYIK